MKLSTQEEEEEEQLKEKQLQMNSPRTNGAISALPSTLAQLALRDKQQAASASASASNGSDSSAPTQRPQTQPPSVPAATSAVNKLQLSDTSASVTSSNGDSNKLTHDLQEKEAQQQQKPQKPPLPVRQKPMEIAGYVGFANLPNQVYRKAVKRGFEFTLMVVGASGLGKSTLINSMFLSDIYNAEQYPGPSLRKKKTVAVEATKVMLKENGVNLTLTVVDTPGFGDAVDNSNCWVPILEYVDSKYEEYLTAESRVYRKTISDNRVHCCLYFIAPSGHGLLPLDIACMQSLSDKVNLVPVIAKADTMTPDEVHLFKKQILNEIAQHKIKIYDFPATLEDAAEESKATQNLRSRVPFAVVGANTIIEIDGKKVRGRRYPWGLVEVENLTHCDFIALRNMVIRTHLQDLKDVTNNVHYENYRCRKLSELGLVDGKARLSNKNPLTQMEEEKREHEQKMKKMEAEMEQVFDMKVKEKMQSSRTPNWRWPVVMRSVRRRLSCRYTSWTRSGVNLSVRKKNGRM